MSCHRDTARAGPSHKAEISFVIPHIKLLKEGHDAQHPDYDQSCLVRVGHPYCHIHLQEKPLKHKSNEEPGKIQTKPHFLLFSCPTSKPSQFVLLISSLHFFLVLCGWQMYFKERTRNADGLKFFFSLWFFSRQRFSV